MFIPYLKLMFVFASMLVGMRFKLGLGFSALGGSLLMALLFGISPLRWLELGAGIFTDVTILTVWGVIILVLALSSLMESTGQAERFMSALAYKIKSPIVRMVFFPVLIGMLPMPGGAVFSAPMINAVAKDLAVPEEDKSLINYWFRHSMEMCWPLFPALILAAGIGGFSTPQLVLWTSPMAVVFFIIGWAFFIRPLKVATPPPLLDSEDKGWKPVFQHGAPILVALVGALGFEVFFAFLLPQFPMDYGVLVALVLAVALCLKQNSLGLPAFLAALRKPGVRSMIFIVGALGVFKNVLAGGGVVALLVDQGAGTAALWMTALVLPVLVGVLTGMMMACVGSAFPLLVVLVESTGSGNVIPWMVLGMTSTLAGCMATPLHICFVLSCEYFKVNMSSSLRRLVAPSFLFMMAGIGYFLLIR